MSQRIIAMEGEAPIGPNPKLEFCPWPGCTEFAQTADPACENTLKYYCQKHEAAAIANGQTGKREPLSDAFHNTYVSANGKRGINLHHPKPKTEKKAMPETTIKRVRGRELLKTDKDGKVLASFPGGVTEAAKDDKHKARLYAAIKSGNQSDGAYWRWADAAAATKPETPTKPTPAHTQSAPATPVAAGPAARPSGNCGREPAGPLGGDPRPVVTGLDQLKGLGDLPSATNRAIEDILAAVAAIQPGNGGKLRVLYIEREF